MRLAVIGAGRIGVMHARNAAQHPDVTSVTIAARTPERVADAARRVRAALAPDAPAELAGAHAPSGGGAEIAESTDVTALLEQVDGVVVASSTASHPTLVRQAVAAGVPVLVEKPLALDLAELESLSDELEAHDVPVMVAFQRRYDPAYQRLRQLVHDGDLGTVRVARASGHDRRRVPLDYIAGSGGMWRDLMIHDFDVVPWVVGEDVVQVHAVGAVLDEPAYAEHDDVDTGVALLTFASGAIATISGTRHNAAGHDVRLEVFGTRNTYGVGFDDHLPVHSADPGGWRPDRVHEDFMARFEPAFRAQTDHFLRLVRGEAENLTPPRAGVPSLRIALAADESRRTGRPVDLTT